MLRTLRSVAFSGIDTYDVLVEVNVVNRGLPSFDIVGLPSKAVAESKHRIKAAIINSGLRFPNKKITVNLCPANIPKDSTLFDLPIALGILATEVPEITVDSSMVLLGELSLSGELVCDGSIFSVCVHRSNERFEQVIVPASAGPVIYLQEKPTYLGAKTLKEVVDFLSRRGSLDELEGRPNKNPIETGRDVNPDILSTQLACQQTALRALEISVAGGHHLLLVGSPGVGKTTLARTARQLLPPLQNTDILSVSKIYAAKGLLTAASGFVTQAPMRAPHTTVSLSGLYGGGPRCLPGEISLAHKGILFMDEFFEFPRSHLDALRQPLEDGFANVLFRGRAVRLPADFILIAAANPCPCGYKDSGAKKCTCSVSQVQRYRNRLSGPILERIDLQVWMRVSTAGDKHHAAGPQVNFTNLEEEIIAARILQKKRYGSREMLNAKADIVCVQTLFEVDKHALEFVESLEAVQTSVREKLKLLRLSRTIADLESSYHVTLDHVMEAFQYRCRY